MSNKNHGQVQTNDLFVNVLVDTTNSSNRHYSSYNKSVEVKTVLTDDEILELWKNRPQENELKFAKDWLKKQKGYAVSDCVDETLNIRYSSLITYEEL